MKRRTFVKLFPLATLQPLAGKVAFGKSAGDKSAGKAAGTGGVPEFAGKILHSNMDVVGPDGKPTGQKATFKGQALVSKQPFNTIASYLENMFAGKTGSAPCTDAINKDLFKKDLAGTIICTPQTVGSTMGAGALMGMNDLGVGPRAFLFSSHIDSIAAGGLIIDDGWNGRRVITIDLLGNEFLETVKTGDKIKISEDGTVEVG